MIFEQLFSVIAEVLGWILGAMPAWSFLDAQWYEQATTWWVQNVITLGFQMATWLPIKTVGTIAATYVTFVSIQFTIVALRAVLSLFTGGGGSVK